MNAKRVLLISPHFPPSAASGAFRILGFTRHLPAWGWSVSIVASRHMPGEPIDESLAASVPSTVRITYVDYPQGTMSGIARRVLQRSAIIDQHALWAWAAMSPCRRVIDRSSPDVIFTSGPPHSVHLLGLQLKRQLGLPWIADFRDPWVARGRRSRRWDYVRGILERMVMREADGIIANAPRALRSMQEAYPAFADKMVVITNGYDPENWSAPGLADGGPPREHVTILHAGELYAGRDPGPLVRALSGVGAEPSGGRSWRLVFMGRAEGCRINVGSEVRDRAGRLSVVHEAQEPYAVAKERMRRADILLLMDGPGRRIGVPAKVYEYIGAGRPILALTEVDGDTAWALRESGAVHRIASPTDVVSIRKAAIELAATTSTVSGTIAATASSRFSRSVIAARLALLLDQVTDARSRSGSPLASLGSRGDGDARRAGYWESVEQRT